MAPKGVSPAPTSLFPIGDCEVVVEGKKFTCDSGPKTLQISFSRNKKVKISVREEMNKESGNVPSLAKCVANEDEKIVSASLREYMFLLVNPNDDDAFSRSYLQEVLKLYIKELPDMNYAANTRKQSAFLERCVSKSKYCTLILKSMLSGGGASNEIIAAITYQIVPADTQYAEIPLAAVTSIHQKKGYGKLIYGELKKRLQNVGVRAIFCWGDKESEGFWLKQDFISIAEVDQKGKASKLRIKANIRKALCFPGGSTLMVSYLKKESSANPTNLPSSSLQLNPLDSNIKLDSFTGTKDSMDSAIGKERNNMVIGAVTTTYADTDGSSPGTKRTWQASLSSLKSKRVKGTHRNGCEVDMDRGFSRSKELKELKDCSSFGTSAADPLNVTCKANDAGECRKGNGMTESLVSRETHPNKEHHRILLMDIDDENKRAFLAKVIGNLGGVITSNGSMSTHIVTGKVRKTLNFCTALCSGAWIVSPTWLKESFREGSFANEALYILHDEDYLLKYLTELKSTLLRAKARPRSLLRGYDICIGAHVQPAVGTLSAIIKSAGGNVIGLGNVREASKTIFIASEDDMEEALSAVKKGIWTFSSDWLMSCVMRQKLDLEAPQFAESL